MTSVPHLGRGRTRSESESDLAGLTDAEVLKRVRRGQANDVPQTTSRTLSQIVRTNVFTPFTALLVVIVIVGPIQDALFGGSSWRTRSSASCKNSGRSGRWTGSPS
jgi:magnesium-transporting ATPase (P-type)